MKPRVVHVEVPEPDRELPVVAVTVEEAAEILRCGRTTVFQLLKEGRLKAVPVGRKRIISMAEIHRFLGGAA